MNKTAIRKRSAGLSLFAQLAATFALAIGLMGATSGTAEATFWKFKKKDKKCYFFCDKPEKPKPPTSTPVPELDPSAGGQAALLLLGGTAILLGRRRRED